MIATRMRVLTLIVSAFALVLVACGGDNDESTAPSGAGDTTATQSVTMTAATATTGTAHQGHSMASPEAGEDPNLHFIDAMIVHHASAVAMAEAVQDSAEHPEIRELAADVITAQESEIEQMRAWRDAWFPGAPESDLTAMEDMAGMAMSDADLKMLEDADSPDEMFIEMMIPHHESAIDMAEQIAQTTQRPELKQLSDEIIAAQQGEIDQMKQWQAEWFGQ